MHTIVEKIIQSFGVDKEETSKLRDSIQECYDWFMENIMPYLVVGKVLASEILKSIERNVSRIFEKVLPFLKVAKDICVRICKMVLKGFLWLVRCVANPTQEINKILNDPEKKDWEKVLGISLVLAVGMFWIIFSTKGRTILAALGGSFLAFLFSTPLTKAAKV